MLRHFYFNEGVFNYGFSETHPLKPERLHRMFSLLDRYASDYKISAHLASSEELARVHEPEYLDGVRFLSDNLGSGPRKKVEDLLVEFAFWGDNPAFPGMYEAASAYAGATAAAAKAVVDGAELSFGIGGGLHHALRAKASGFCIFNDCAIACSILRDRFERVAYVDVDVHHGDGVQWIFYNDPSVLTCSIHESGRTLWPGTGGVDEVGVDHSSVNVPVMAGTTRDVWLDGFTRTIIPALKKWKPQAIVLQMGTDTHHLDPLAHLDSDQSAWLSAILQVQALGVPLVALGGGGYNLTTVPRMWVSAVLSLAGIPFDDRIPEDLIPRLGVRTFTDPDYAYPSFGQTHMDNVVDQVAAEHKLSGS